jgi:hypothetical protein
MASVSFSDYHQAWYMPVSFTSLIKQAGNKFILYYDGYNYECNIKDGIAKVRPVISHRDRDAVMDVYRKENSLSYAEVNPEDVTVEYPEWRVPIAKWLAETITRETIYG